MNKKKKLENCKLKEVGKKLNNKITWIAVSAVVILFCFFGIVGLGAVQLGWDNSFTNTIVKALPYPAAMVDGKVVKYSEWKFETEAVILLSEKRLNEYSVEDVKEEVLQKLIYDELMEKIAKKNNIKVTDEDIDGLIARLVEQVGSEEELEKNVKDFFNWDMKTFKEHVVYSDALREKLEKELPLNEKNLREAEKEAEAVLREVTDGEKSFEELAQMYSQDPVSAAQGGDLGWFAKGVMVKEFEDAVFAMNPGDVSDLVKTDFGYHIIKLEDKKAAEVLEDGTESGEQVKASHILIRPMIFNDYLSELEKSAKVWRFVNLDGENK